jgi:type IV secretory pathway TrbL component
MNTTSNVVAVPTIAEQIAALKLLQKTQRENIIASARAVAKLDRADTRAYGKLMQEAECMDIQRTRDIERAADCAKQAVHAATRAAIIAQCNELLASVGVTAKQLETM